MRLQLEIGNVYIKGLDFSFCSSFSFLYIYYNNIFSILHMNSNKQISNTTNIQSQYDALEEIQQHLDDLQTDRASMEIVYTSLKNAFLIYPSAEWDEIDKEICRAYDDLMAQVRQLDRSLKKLDKCIKSTTEQNVNKSTYT